MFADLTTICRQPGYVHAIAHLCFRDNTLLCADEVKEADMRKMLSPSRLIRTEINTLLGLMIKADIDWSVPPPKTMQDYIDSTERLLEELHHCLSGEFFTGLTKEAVESGSFNPFARGEVLREPIFYSGESEVPIEFRLPTGRSYAARGCPGGCLLTQSSRNRIGAL